MIEVLTHDLGKASQGRFKDHAEASAEMLRKAGFEEEAVLNLIERHHKSLGGDDSNLRLLQLADRRASSCRVDGGNSAAFRKVLDYNYLRLTEAYLVHDLNEHFLKFGDDYNAFRRFIQNCWWLELVKASTSDVSNASLREHLLLTDSIYQIHLKAIDRFGSLEGRKAEDWLRYLLSRIKIPAIDGRPKDLRLRIELLGILGEEGMRSYEVWKGLKERGIHKKFEFVDKVLKELSKVGVLERNEERKYNLQKSLESKHSFKEANYGLPSDDKIKDAIMKRYSEGFEIEGIAYQVGLPQLHVREVLNDGISH